MAPTILGRLFHRSDESGDRKRRAGGASSSDESRWVQIRPEDPERPCPIARLSEELLLHIFGLVATTSPQTAANLALVHPRFCGPARYVQHRRVRLDLSNRHDVAAHRLDFIEKEGRLLLAIQELHVFSQFETVDAACLERLADMMAGMTGLRAVHWEACGPMPAAMLQALRGRAGGSSPSEPVKLHVVIRDRSGHGTDPDVQEQLADLAGCAGLVALTLDAAYLDASGCLDVTQPLKQILLTCPRLEHLSLDVHLPHSHGGCVAYAPFVAYPGLGLAGGQHPLRPLTSLTLHAYPWGQAEVPGRWTFYSRGYPADADADERDYWATRFDWSALQRLDVMLPGELQQLAIALAPHLTALRAVCFRVPRSLYCHDMTPFFDSVPSRLESITLSSLDTIGGAGAGGGTGLARHAPGLRRLVVHQSGFADVRDDPPSAVTLGTLLTRTPRLEELGLDLPRHGGDWPRAHLDVLARCCPRLRALELWFGLGSGWFSVTAAAAARRPAPPDLTASAAAQLFSDLRAALPHLQRLRVHAGPGKNDDTWVQWAGSRSYPHDNATHFVCSVAERDDDDQAAVSVTSLSLSPRLNARMQRILRGEERREDVPGHLLVLRVALDGPLSYADWKQWNADWPMPNAPALMDAAEGWTFAEADKPPRWRGVWSRLCRRGQTGKLH